VYAGSSVLPSESDQVVSEMDKARMSGTGEKTLAEAEELMSQVVESYWYSMFLVAGIGVVGLAAFAVRKSGRMRARKTHRANFGVAIVAVVIVLVMVLGGVLYTMTLGFGGTSSQEPPWPDGNEFNERAEQRFSGIDFNDPFSGDETSSGGAKTSEPVVVRNYFPETWYWNPCLLTDETGHANITLQAPDSITSWKTDVIASTLDGRIGTQTASITVFQPFFIDPDIPVSVVRNDTFPLKVQVYNYINRTQQVNVTLTPESWFTLSSASTKTITVPANYVAYVTFTIQATKAGWHTISIGATAGEVGDALVKPIHVVPDGTKIETLFNGEADNSTATHTLLLDPDRIEGGETSWVKLQGGVEAVLLEGVEAYINFVTGCGEQSLSTLSIDILAYDTVVKLGTAPEKLFEYESMVNQGIQHELTFLVDPNNGQGRGIVWFPGDQDAHPWLTSWGLIAFQDAINAGFGLDAKIIQDMQKWLMSIQDSDGSWAFPEWGIYEFNNPILRAKEISSTAYIARALLYSGVPGSDEHVRKAVEYIEANVGSVSNDPYSTALVLLVLQQGGGSTSLRAQLATSLNELKKEENGTYYWSSSTNMLSDNGGDEFAMDLWGGYSSSRVIETTGYAATALHGETGYHNVVQGAVKYLLNHRQELGGWYSTQDTIVAFQTLNTVGGDNSIQDLVAEVMVDGSVIYSVEMSEFNKDVTYYVDLRPHLENVTNVSVRSTGTGTLLYSVYLAQYVPWPAQAESSPFLTLEVTYDATHIQVTDSLTAHMRLLYDGPALSLKMILVDLRAPMGFAFELSEFDALLENGTISSYDSTDRQVLVYLTDVVSGTPIEFDYSLVAELPIRSTVQDISAWDMYDPNNVRAEALPVQFEAT
jgi:CD109 antigen